METKLQKNLSSDKKLHKSPCCPSVFLTRNSFIGFIARSDCVKFSALNETIGCETRKEIMMCGKEELRSMGNGERHSKKRAGCVI